MEVKKLNTQLIEEFALLHAKAKRFEDEKKTASDSIKTLILDEDSQVDDSQIHYSSKTSESNPDEITETFEFGPRDSQNQLVVTCYTQSAVSWKDIAKSSYVALLMAQRKTQTEAEAGWIEYTASLEKKNRKDIEKLEVKPNPRFKPAKK